MADDGNVGDTQSRSCMKNTANYYYKIIDLYDWWSLLLSVADNGVNVQPIWFASQNLGHVLYSLFGSFEIG